MIVVLALLGMLLLVGMMFYTVANQEQASAEYFIKAAKEAGSGPAGAGGGGGGGGGGASGFGADFEIALRQLIAGPETDETNSALWGGRKSLLATMYGRSVHPFTGRGVNLIVFSEDLNGNGVLDPGEDLNGNGVIDVYAVDQDGNGQPDVAANQALLELNDSPAAWGQVPLNFSRYPAPDVDYTYPDHNNPFLAYHGFAVSINGAPVRVVIPSFHRPALMRVQDEVDGEIRGIRLTMDYGLDGIPGTADDVFDDQNGWWSALPTRSLRAHPDHVDVAPDGFNPTPRGRRYILTQAEADSLGASGPFPFVPDYYNERLPNGALGEQGIWSLSPWRPNTEYREGEWVVARRTTESVPGANDHRGNGMFYRRMMWQPGLLSGNQEPNWSDVAGNNVSDPPNVNNAVWRAFSMMTANYEYDADPDGDGIREAVWLDLDAPVIQLGGGKKAIRLYAITVYDADGLLNLNAHGNVEGRVNLAETRNPALGLPFGYDAGPDGIPNTADDGLDFLSRSNLGVSPSEVNPQYGFNAAPGPGADGIPGTADDDVAPVDRGSDVFEQLRLYFGHDPLNPAELANMEWWLMNVGRMRFSGSATPASMTNYLPGRYGEMDTFVQNFFNTGALPDTRYDATGAAQFPSAGRSGFYDAIPGTNPAVGNETYGTGLDGQRRFVHPLDFRGLGRMTRAAAAADAGRLPRLFDTWGADFNPMSWPQYMNYSYATQPPGAQQPAWVTLMGGNLGLYSSPLDPDLVRRLVDPLLDEAYELDLESPLGQADDARFSAADSLALQLSGADIDNVSLSSRLFTLAEYNLKRNVRSNDLRRRFTTHSRDLKTFGTSYDFEFPAPRQAFEWGPDPANVQNPGQITFPRPWPDPAVQDPLRPELRRLLTVLGRGLTTGTEVNNPDPLGTTGVRAQQQRRLSVNHVLEAAGLLLQSSPLTDHPPDPGAIAPTVDPQELRARRDRQLLARDIYVMLYLFCGGDDAVDYFTTPNLDLGPDTIHDPDGTLGLRLRTLYDDWQLNEMAQFAINLVDGMDRDSVIDAFEFDRDLSDGWDPDDNPYPPALPAVDPDPAKLKGQHGLVYGVEAQQFTFSEAMAIRSVQFRNVASDPNSAEDIPVTEFNDEEDRYFTFVELRNASPAPIDLTANEPNGTPGTGHWQIQVVRVYDDDNDPNTPDIEQVLRKLTLFRNPPPPGGGGPGSAIPGGGLFSILSAGDRTVNDSVTSTNEVSQFVVDVNFDPALMNVDYNGKRLAPRFYQVQHELDLINDSTAGNSLYFRLTDDQDTNDKTGSGGLLDAEVGQILGFTSGENSGGAELRLRLFRRSHTARSVPTASSPAYDSDNPWVLVDETEIGPNRGFSEFNMTDTDESGFAAQDKLRSGPLGAVKSVERSEPLSRRTDDLYPLTGTPAPPPVANIDEWRMNTVGEPNRRSIDLGAASQLWQAHFDRDFANLGELFAVPLYDSSRVTLDLDPTREATPNPLGWHTAGRKFLRPVEKDNVSDVTAQAYGADGAPGIAGFDDDGDGQVDNIEELGWPGSDDALKYTNRWHRLFEFIEVPTPVNSPAIPHMSGKINWNTIRYPAVLAGLVDDRSAFGSFSDWIPGTTPFFPTPGYMGDASGEIRDWWVEFMRSRDRQDRVTGTLLPGNPEARPVRGANYLAEGPLSLGETMFRELPRDADPASLPLGVFRAAPDDRRRLFELSTVGQRDEYLAGNADTSDAFLKHRLLGKMLNNSTTRSNVFFVFIEVGLFEVWEGPDPVTGLTVEKIGARLSGVEQPRAMFVIDRTRAHAVLDAPHFAEVNDPADPAVFRFVDFPWQSLVVGWQRIE